MALNTKSYFGLVEKRKKKVKKPRSKTHNLEFKPLDCLEFTDLGHINTITRSLV